MRIGLVLAAGGSVGVAYHGGVLAALEEATGWDPRRAAVMVGTSAGSISASLLRAGVPASDLACISEDLPLSAEGARLAALGRPRRPRPSARDLLTFRPVADPVGVAQGLMRPCLRSRRGMVAAALPAGTISTEPISSGIDAMYRGRWAGEPLWICALDLRSGRRTVFGRDGAPATTVGRAVAASAAVPAWFRPVEIGGRRYVDGGVHSMANVDLVADAGLDLAVVVSPLSAAYGSFAASPLALARLALRAGLHRDVASIRAAGVPVVAIEPGRRAAAAMGLNPMDAARRQAVSRSAREGVRDWLRSGVEGRRLAGILRTAGADPGLAPGRPGPAATA